MRTVQANLDLLIEDLIRAIKAGSSTADWPDGAFFGFATRIVRLQTRDRRIEVSGLADVPATSTDTFRYSQVGVLSEPRQWAAEFRTSGTTNSYRGLHRLYRADIYRASALICADHLLFDRFPVRRLVSLVPLWAEARDSSLSYMIDSFRAHRFPETTTFAFRDGRIDFPLLKQSLRDATADRAPIMLFSTTLAAAALSDSDLSAELPRGSVIITTGGAKGRRNAVDGASVAHDLGTRFGVPHGSEYGMTELLSQAYQVGDEPFVLPPWCRVVAFDPVSGQPLPHHETGLLRFVDLANVQSAIAVQTADLGETISHSSFRLHGRARGAPLRGCSLTFEELAGGEE